MKRLWDKGEATNELMRELTVGSDPVIDRELVYFDALGSAAHAKMLCVMKYLPEHDIELLLPALREIAEQGKAGAFNIPAELEDCHTAIENELVTRCGDAGKRIHTARSRNDQVLLAVRLYLRDVTVNGLGALIELSDSIASRIASDGDLPLPGYTHLQPAMPSSVSMWLQGWAEGINDLLRAGCALYDGLDSNPLGSGAGFGTNLTIDREYVTKVLAFSRTQRNPIDCNNSRGRYEERYLRWATDVASLFEKLAWDVLIYSTREFGFVTLPHDLTTGSSIMPQKRNLDIVELLRGRASRVRGALHELSGVIAKLPSSYHRDFQYTKEPLIRAVHEMDRIFGMASLIIKNLKFNAERLKSSMYTDLYATYDANVQVGQGVPFRDAYRTTAERVEHGSLNKDMLMREYDKIQHETKLLTDESRKELEHFRTQHRTLRTTLEEVERTVFSPVIL
jgi:argininosuccinate lyase